MHAPLCKSGILCKVFAVKGNYALSKVEGCFEFSLVFLWANIVNFGRGSLYLVGNRHPQQLFDCSRDACFQFNFLNFFSICKIRAFLGENLIMLPNLIRTMCIQLTFNLEPSF